MIEGLKLDIKSSELQGWLESRITHHNSKIEWYQKQTSMIEENLDQDLFANSPSNNPTTTIRAKIDQHTQTRDLFKFMAEHLVPSEIYRLQQSDLETIEIIKRRW